jgi:hypothetical protein
MVAGATLVIAGAVAAEDPQDVKPLVERFLKSAGGVEPLNQPRPYTYQVQLTTKVPGKPDVVVPETYYIQPPDKLRLEEEIQKEGKSVKYVQVINGNKGWASTGGERRDLTPASIARRNEPQQTFGYKYILTLRDPAYTPAKMGESELKGRAVEGIQLTYGAGRGSRNVHRLFFDKQSGLLAMRGSGDPQKKGTYSEVNYEDYRLIGGIAVPHKVTYTSVGVRPAGRDETTWERVYSNFKFVDKLDPKLFEAP